MGFEPTTLWTTTRCSNQLSYSHHDILVRPEGLEPPALWAETTRSNPTELRAPILKFILPYGAGNGDRTRISTLEGWHNSHYTIPALRIHSV